MHCMMCFSTKCYNVGNEVHISVCTETEYEKRDGSNHFGLKCQAVGYEWSSNPTEVYASLGASFHSQK